MTEQPTKQDPPVTAAPVPGVERAADGVLRWRGFTHKELYRMLHDGPGAAASAAPSRRWSAVSASLADIAHDLGKALESTGGGWTGRAAGAAYDKLAPLAEWARQTSDSAHAMRLAVEHQGDYVAKARADMPVPEDVPPVQPDPTAPPAAAIVAAQTDAEPVEAAQATGEARAFEVMAAYEQSTESNLETLSPFTSPARLSIADDQHRGRGDGVENSTHSSSAITDFVIGGGERDQVDSRPNRPGGRGEFPGGGFAPGRGDDVHLAGSTVQAEPEAVRRQPLAQGQMSGASVEPTLGAPHSGGSKSTKSTKRVERTPNLGAGQSAPAEATANAPTPANTSGTAGAGTPMGSAGTPTGSADRVAMRRFGTDALGSGQWFGDQSDGPGRAVSGRRRDLGGTEQVTESVSIDGEDFQLPPTVIGG